MQQLLQQQRHDHCANPYPALEVRLERIERLQRMLEHNAHAGQMVV